MNIGGRRACARIGGGQARIGSQRTKGRLTARKRMDVLLDAGSLSELDMYVDPDLLEWRAAIDSITVNAVVASVPERASWAMMIVGLGMLGVGMRREKTVASFA